MIPVRLELKNFLAYRSPDPLRFDGVHLACLIGPNGAGKSSLLDAITWALWGRARAKRDDEMVHMGQSDMHVQLDFEQEGTIYRVVRRRSRKQRGMGSLDLFAEHDNTWNTLSEPSIRETQDKINRLLRLDYETFVHSAFLQQGKADAFTLKPAAQRKQILSDILGLEEWAAYEETSKEILKQIANELQVIEGRITDIESELRKEPALRKSLSEAEVAQAEAKAALDVAEVKLKELAHAPRDMDVAIQRKSETERRLNEHRKDLTSAQGEIERHQTRIAGYQDILAQREAIEAGYAALTSAREQDFDLGDKLLQLSNFDDERRDLENRLRDARAELEQEASGCRARIIELERTIQSANADDLAVVQAEVMALQDLEAQRSSFDEMARGLGEEKAELEGVRKTLTIEGQTLGERLTKLRATDAPVCPLCGQPLDEEHRAQLIAQLDEEIVARRADYAQTQERMREIGDELKERRVQISELDLELKRLPPLMERAGALQGQIDNANAAAARLEAERSNLDTVTALLESEAYAQDTRAQLATLEQNRSAVGYDADSHSAARQQLEAYREYEVHHQKLDLALSSLPDVEAALEAAQNRAERFLGAIAEEEEQVEALITEMAALEVLVREFHTREQEVNALRTAERQQNERLVAAQQELKALENQRARKADLEERREVKRYDEGIYKELRNAFGKNGVPAMIIEAAIPELEESSNRLLSRMTDGRMHLRFSTQKEKSTGDGVIETLDIQIADELGTRSYEMYSGGEAFRINFAIRVALSQMLARRAGAHLRTLFIDEGFGTQDEDGRNKLVEAITAIQNDFDLILVITHLDDLRDSFPVHVVVQKTPNGSRISLR